MDANLEVEVKIRCASADAGRARLRAAGAEEIERRVFEDNVVYDRRHDPLSAGGRLLRLRRVGERWTVTFKAPVAGEHRHKVREEHETAVDDGAAVDRIFRGLDFMPAYRYQKFRTIYELDGVHACLDETPIGCFIELEGAPDAIDRVATRLGYGPGDFLRDTYLELHASYARERGIDAGDLLFDFGDSGSIPR